MLMWKERGSIGTYVFNGAVDLENIGRYVSYQLGDKGQIFERESS
jgi:hypothetical protein